MIRFADLYDHQLADDDRERGSAENAKHAHRRVPPPDQQQQPANAKRQTSELDGPNEKTEPERRVNAQEKPVKKIVMEMGVNGRQEAPLDGIAKRPAAVPLEHPPGAATMGFDLSHQPILVIYTTTAG